MKSINKMVNEAVKIAKDDSHGYDQATRTGGVDYDCSSLTAHCLIVGGFNVNKKSTTMTLYNQLIKEGFKEVKGNPKKGDIFLTPGKHVVISNTAKKVVTASINEKGTATGGKPGDQTGKEIYIRDFYEPSYKWKYHLRYFEASNKEETKKEEAKTPKKSAYENEKYYDIAIQVIAGKYGNGVRRKVKLGSKYKAVQTLVNKILKERK